MICVRADGSRLISYYTLTFLEKLNFMLLHICLKHIISNHLTNLKERAAL